MQYHYLCQVRKEKLEGLYTSPAWGGLVHCEIVRFKVSVSVKKFLDNIQHPMKYLQNAIFNFYTLTKLSCLSV